jgi:uncharacterized protein
MLAAGARGEKPEQLKPQGYVNDFAGVLDAQAKAQLTALCTEVDQKARAQIAVVTIRSLEGVAVEEFSHRLATRWGVGYKGDNRGLLILLAVRDRKYRIEVGYGLEPILPDGKVGGFGREMVPLLRQGDYGGALLQVTGRIADVIAADRGITLLTRRPPAAPVEPSPPPESPRRPESLIPRLSLWILLLFVWLLWKVMKAVLSAVATPFVWTSERASWTRGKHLRGWGEIWWDLFRTPWVKSSGCGSSGGGFWSLGSSGGGGFGGFGGGSFGGGGASGSW